MRQLFTEESLDNKNVKQKGGAYAKTANPGAWVLLTAVIIAFAGLLIWGSFAKLDIYYPVTCVVMAEPKDPDIYIYCDNAGEYTMRKDDTIVVEDSACAIREIYVQLGYDGGYRCYGVCSNPGFAPGVYKGKLLDGRLSPFEMILHGVGKE